jgi:hypothetical protein
MSYPCEDGEPVEFSKETVRKARKQWTCDACHGTIEPGHYYCLDVSKWDGRIDTVRRCGSCELTYHHLREVTPSGEYPSNRLDCGDEYADVHDKPPPPEIARLAFLPAAEAGELLAPVRREVEIFNARYPVGTKVFYWAGVREGPGTPSKTRTPAQVLSGHTAVVWIEDRPDCISLSHIKVPYR